MIINLKNKKFGVIFVHIQKSGGSSIIDFFNVRKNHNKIYHDIEFIKRNSLKLNNFFKFVVIRNPWDRIVSFFHYHKQKTMNINFPTRTWEYIRNLNFTQFIRSSQFQYWSSRNNITNYIKYQNVPYIDYYIDFNNLKKDFELIKKLTGINKNLPHINKSKHDSYQKYYRNAKNKDIIQCLFKEEIKFFDFKFDCPTNFKSLNNNKIISKFLKK